MVLVAVRTAVNRASNQLFCPFRKPPGLINRCFSCGVDSYHFLGSFSGAELVFGCCLDLRTAEKQLENASPGPKSAPKRPFSRRSELAPYQRLPLDVPTAHVATFGAFRQ